MIYLLLVRRVFISNTVRYGLLLVCVIVLCCVVLCRNKAVGRVLVSERARYYRY